VRKENLFPVGAASEGRGSKNPSAFLRESSAAISVVIEGSCFAGLFIAGAWPQQWGPQVHACLVGGYSLLGLWHWVGVLHFYNALEAWTLPGYESKMTSDAIHLLGCSWQLKLV
jgi:hypothetical protein